MEKEELERLAEKLYNACSSVKPTWRQLGDVTRSVWMERAQATLEQHSSQEKS